MKTIALRFFIGLLVAMVCIVTAPCVCSAHAATVAAASHACCPHCFKTTQTPNDCPHCKGSAFEKTVAHVDGPVLMPPMLAPFAEVFEISCAVRFSMASLPTLHAFPQPAQSLLNQHCASLSKQFV